VLHIGLSRQELDRVQALIADLDAAPPSPGAERRIRPRIDFCHAMWLSLPLAPGKPWVRIHSRNLSTGGLAFVARQPFALGSYVVVSHHLNEGCDQLALCLVRFCRQADVRLYETGVEFEQVVNDPDSHRRVPTEWASLVLRNLWVARASTGGILTPNTP